MVLPFVRDLFTDVEKLPAFARVASHLKEGTGRISVSGLTPTAKALLLVLLQRAADRPLILVGSDNRSMEDFVPLLQAFCELTGAADPETIVALPTRDVLPFQNLSPHPELQEERAVALWKIATGAVSIIVSPITATALRLRSAEYYADLARIVRRGDTFDTDPLLRHLNTVGYTSTDVVEMPGEYALRGGILDVYSPEADRPVRVEFFGDEVESIPKFEHTWSRIEEAHERSGVGNLVRPADLYLSPAEWWAKLGTLRGADVEHLGIERTGQAEAVTFHSQPTPRFHGSVPAMLEQVQKQTAEGKRVLIAVPNTGEIERLADIFTEYAIYFSLASRTRSGESYADETAYFAGEVLTTTLAKAYVPDGVALPDANLTIFGARDLFDESESVVSRPQRQKSKTSAFLSDFRDLQVGDYVVHVEHGIGQYQGLKEINQGD